MFKQRILLLFLLYSRTFANFFKDGIREDGLQSNIILLKHFNCFLVLERICIKRFEALFSLFQPSLVLLILFKSF